MWHKWREGAFFKLCHNAGPFYLMGVLFVQVLRGKKKSKGFVVLACAECVSEETFFFLALILKFLCLCITKSRSQSLILCFWSWGFPQLCHVQDPPNRQLKKIWKTSILLRFWPDCLFFCFAFENMEASSFQSLWGEYILLWLGVKVQF